MKVAVIGAGSTYTPELVSGLSRERDKWAQLVDVIGKIMNPAAE